MYHNITNEFKYIKEQNITEISLAVYLARCKKETKIIFAGKVCQFIIS